jgi:hypothetical protein
MTQQALPAQVDQKKPSDEKEQPTQLIYKVPSLAKVSFGDEFAPLFLRQLHVLERQPDCYEGAQPACTPFFTW